MKWWQGAPFGHADEAGIKRIKRGSARKSGAYRIEKWNPMASYIGEQFCVTHPYLMGLMIFVPTEFRTKNILQRADTDPPGVRTASFSVHEDVSA